ncbi:MULTISPECIES: EF-hand domain-containing protein [Shewanella]|jgi:Ca2+-binding EF-hand superfamily protein|uniref:EF hand domain-containing protein n=1 Tax=Shewanella fodinae TaxID=552357 RepID=A0A4R2F9L6_9GAMM|nr:MULTISPECIES: EF-hand domain-containing protein [Shewanella]MBO1272306.1 EF-hand domain-containing protein [Shewanella sp. 4t3-1-2LB]TCN84282.1 EF hand domain-containing protein [Shewanella fodinae]
MQRYLLALSLLLPTACMAANQPQQGYFAKRAEAALAERFSQADSNKDGKLTLEEAKKGMPRVAENFDSIDTNHQGFVTLEQLKTVMATRASQKS